MEYYRNLMEEGKETIIPMEQLMAYINSLEEEQGKELLAAIRQHPQLEVVRQLRQEYVKGDQSFLRQLSFLLKTHAQRQPQAVFDQSSLTSEQPIPTTPKTCSSLHLSSKTFLPFIHQIRTLKTLSPLLRTFTLDDRFTIHNRCELSGKVILLFRQYHELILLQSMAQQTWVLESFIPIREAMEMKKLSAVRGNNDYGFKLLLLRAVEKEKVNWRKFSQHILSAFKDAREDENQCILTTSDLLAELRSHARLFGKALNLVVHEDDLRLPADEQIQNITVSRPAFPLDTLLQLAQTILKRNAREWSYKGEPLDPITCFNIVAIESKNISEHRLTLDSPHKQRYLLMVDSFQLFRIATKTETSEIELQPADFSQISDLKYLQEISTMRVWAVLHQLPFISFPQKPSEIHKIQQKELTKVGTNCYSRLLYYNWKLSQMTYRVDIIPGTPLQNWEQDFQMRFDNGDSIISYLGKLSLQTQGFKRRFRIDRKPCVEGSREFCSKVVKMKLAE